MGTSDAKSKSNLFWERVRGRFLPGTPKPSPAEDDPRRRWVAITFCLLISCVLWFTFTMSESYDVQLEVPTRVVGLSSGQALTQLPDSTVNVNVRGEGIQLLRLYWDPPTITIDAAADQVNLRDLVRTAIPQNVLLEGVIPNEMVLRKEERVTRKVPIRWRGEIDTPPTHELLFPPRLEPDSVVISGAASVIRRIDYWPTERFEREDLRDSLVLRVPLADTLSGLITRSPEMVEVTAVAEQFTSDEREIEVIPRGIEENFVSFEPRTITVRYKVPLSQAPDVRQTPEFFAEVSYEDILDDVTRRVRPKLHLPPQFEVRDVTMLPSSVAYYIRPAE